MSFVYPFEDTVPIQCINIIAKIKRKKQGSALGVICFLIMDLDSVKIGGDLVNQFF